MLNRKTKEYEMPNITWVGKSGNAKEFQVYNWGDELLEIGGVYIIVNDEGIIYVGESKNIKDRISSKHHKYDCIIENNPTHIHVHYQRNKKIRRIIEGDILENYITDCND